MKIENVFDICPICHGTMEVINYDPDMIGTTDMKTEECTHCYFGLIIKDKVYNKMVEYFGIKEKV
jgi:hypothetical protein